MLGWVFNSYNTFVWYVALPSVVVLIVITHAQCISKVHLYVSSDRIAAMLSRCSLASDVYVAMWPLFTGHLQTISLVLMNYFYRTSPQASVRYIRETITLPDGGLISLDWVDPKYLTAMKNRHGRPMLSDGLCRHSMSSSCLLHRFYISTVIWTLCFWRSIILSFKLKFGLCDSTTHREVPAEWEVSQKLTKGIDSCVIISTEPVGLHKRNLSESSTNEWSTIDNEERANSERSPDINLMDCSLPICSTSLKEMITSQPESWVARNSSVNNSSSTSQQKSDFVTHHYLDAGLGFIGILMIVPGLTSNSRDITVKSYAIQGAINRFATVVVNHRSSPPNLTAEKLYCAGSTDDLKAAVDFVNSGCPLIPIMCIGISLGANILVKYLGEQPPGAGPPVFSNLSKSENVTANNDVMDGTSGSATGMMVSGKSCNAYELRTSCPPVCTTRVPIVAAVSVSNPLDLALSSPKMESSAFGLYTRYLTHSLQKYILKNFPFVNCPKSRTSALSSNSCSPDVVDMKTASPDACNSAIPQSVYSSISKMSHDSMKCDVRRQNESNSIVLENEAKSKVVEGLISRSQICLDAVMTAKTLHQFDELFTSKAFGYPDAKTYYECNSSIKYLQGVNTPLLLLHAMDDPICPYDAVDLHAPLRNKSVAIAITTCGGHCAFLSGSLWKPRFWAAEFAVQFISQFVTPSTLHPHIGT